MKRKTTQGGRRVLGPIGCVPTNGIYIIYTGRLELKPVLCFPLECVKPLTPPVTIRENGVSTNERAAEQEQPKRGTYTYSLEF